MAIKTMSALKAQATGDLADNTTQQISPADVRNMITDFLDTMTPAYGALSITSAAGISKTIDMSPAVALNWENVSPDTTPEYTCNTATGTISRAGTTANRIVVMMEVYVAAGKFVTCTLYNGGAATPWKFTAVGQGTSKPTSVSIGAMIRASSLSLQLFVNADANAVPVVFKNAVMYAAAVPVIT